LLGVSVVVGDGLRARLGLRSDAVKVVKQTFSHDFLEEAKSVDWADTLGVRSLDLIVDLDHFGLSKGLAISEPEKAAHDLLEFSQVEEAISVGIDMVVDLSGNLGNGGIIMHQFVNSRAALSDVCRGKLAIVVHIHEHVEQINWKSLEVMFVQGQNHKFTVVKQHVTVLVVHHNDFMVEIIADVLVIEPDHAEFN